MKLAAVIAGVSLWLLSSLGRCEDRALRNIVDEEVQAAWRVQRIMAGPRTTDGEFLRRVSLDLVGVIPSWSEAAAFLDDPAPEKRIRLIDQLLVDPRFAEHQTDVWDNVLFGRNPPGYDTDKRTGIQNWLRRQFSENVPYDEWARALLKGAGNSVEEGPPIYFAQYRNQPEDAAEAITQTFLGIQLQCARCHDHPFESWSQKDFYGMAAFFARLQIVGVGKKDNLTMYAVAEKSTGDVLFTGRASEQQPGKKGDPVKPKFLLGDELAEPPLPEGFQEVKFEENKVPPEPVFSRKNQLAEWVTRADNRFFAPAIANRLWAQFMGRGVVHPVDNMSPSNKPSLPQLKDALAQALKAHNFDLKWYIRELVCSETYQLSSRGEDGNPLPQWYQSGRVRPLTAEELNDSWRAAAWFEATEQYAKLPAPKDRFHPVIRDYMLMFFGSPNNGTGDFQGGLHEHLFVNNGPIASVISSGKGSLVDWLSTAEAPLEQRIERVYLSVLTRRPTAEETALLTDFVTPGKGDTLRWQEVVWALMSGSEFRFNH
jgi:hypothetical protein